MTKLHQKALCYITRSDESGTQVLVFEHIDYPEAGIQVPAGSIEPGETPEEGALREAWEETGIPNLRSIGCLGDFRWWCAPGNEYHQRHVFHLSAPGNLPETWDHVVSAGTGDKGLHFRYYWMDIQQAADTLNGDQGDYLSLLPQSPE